MEKQRHIDWRLLMRYMESELSTEETKQVEEWLQADRKHQAYYDRMVQAWKNDTPYQTDIPKVFQQFENFVDKQRRTRIRKYAIYGSIAASLILAIGISLLFWQGPADITYPMASHYPHPGTQKAILILENGQNINLGKTTDTSDLILETAKIEREQGTIIFEKEHQPLETQYYTISIPRGGEYHVVLEDGSQIWMNAESELRFPSHFTGTERKVILSGEAYFEVTHDPSHPFIVETELGNIQVFGTVFNVRNYKEEENIKATLVSGSIGFSPTAANAFCTKIEPGFQVLCKKNEAPVVQKIKIDNEIAWRNRQFRFERVKLENIMQDIARWYDANITFNDETLKELYFTGTLNRYARIETLLRFFEEGCDIRFEINGKNITIMKK